MIKIRIAIIAIAGGIVLGLAAVLKPIALTIFLFFSVGHALIIGGIALYIIEVRRDLKRHGIL